MENSENYYKKYLKYKKKYLTLKNLISEQNVQEIENKIENTNNQELDNTQELNNTEVELLSAQSGGTAGSGNMLVGDEYTWRKLTPLECERLQTVPDLYTQYGEFDHKHGYLGEVRPISNSQRYKMIGNGFTRAVISHILEGVYS